MMKDNEHTASNTKAAGTEETPSPVEEQQAGKGNEQPDGSQSDVAETADELESLKSELEEARDKHLRLYSEFENFRRRTAKERLELISTANADLISALLPVIDDFERALNSADEDDSSDAQLQGINLIYQKLMKELQQKGLKPMDDLVGKDFDAEMHEAISRIPAPKKSLKNRIVDVVEKGYYLNDKVIRYAKVVIGT